MGEMRSLPLYFCFEEFMKSDLNLRAFNLKDIFLMISVGLLLGYVVGFGHSSYKYEEIKKVTLENIANDKR